MELKLNNLLSYNPWLTLTFGSIKELVSASILGIGGNGCVYHGKPVGEGWV
jgi:hypothetical protein